MNVGQIPKSTWIKAARGLETRSPCWRKTASPSLAEKSGPFQNQTDLPDPDAMSEQDLVTFAERYRNGLHMVTLCLDGVGEEQIRRFTEVGLAHASRPLHDGRTGEPSRGRITVGTMYINVSPSG
ncbi:MAG: hypothetical protein R2941_17320 [Desulfobacterales bacterium]